MRQSIGDTWRGLLDQNHNLSTSSSLSPLEFPWIFNPSSQTSEESSQHTSLKQERSHRILSYFLIQNINALIQHPSS